MDIEQLRRQVTDGEKPLRVTTHAQIEAAKDGLLLIDLRHVFETGRVVEGYPAEQRVLLCGEAVSSKLPVHIVVEDALTEGVIVTAYIPDPRLWAWHARRRRRG